MKRINARNMNSKKTRELTDKESTKKPENRETEVAQLHPKSQETIVSIGTSVSTERSVGMTEQNKEPVSSDNAVDQFALAMVTRQDQLALFKRVKELEQRIEQLENKINRKSNSRRKK